MKRSPFCWWIAVTVARGANAVIGQVPQVAPSALVHAPTVQPPPAGEIEVLPVRGNIYALMGAGANILASVGPDGVMLIDAGTAAMTRKVLAALAQVQREWSARNEPKPLGWGAETRSSVVDRHIAAAAEADSLHRQHRALGGSRRRQREAPQCRAYVHGRQRRWRHPRFGRGGSHPRS